VGGVSPGPMHWLWGARSSRPPFSASRRKLLRAADALPRARAGFGGDWPARRQPERSGRPRSQAAIGGLPSPGESLQNSSSHPLLITTKAQPQFLDNRRCFWLAKCNGRGSDRYAPVFCRPSFACGSGRLLFLHPPFAGSRGSSSGSFNHSGSRCNRRTSRASANGLFC
jgi:hypothetical protein